MCSGLDHAHRGFETFARECFEALRDSYELELELLKGSGPHGPREKPIPTLRRDGWVARAVGRLRGTRPFRVEALSFGFALLPLIARRRPDVVVLSEWDTAHVLARARRVAGWQFKLLWSNGSMAWRGFEPFDCVQELTPAAYEYVLERGADPARHVMLPLGFRIPAKLIVLSSAERRAIRQRLGLPVDRQIIVSVAALNRSHKRLDYVISEVASFRERRPFLLLIGQHEEETPALVSLAHERLGSGNFDIRTVPPAEVEDLCRASDAFVLASLYEGLPRALVEASALGLPCLVHDYPVTSYALGPHGLQSDLREPGALARLIATLDDEALSAGRATARHAYAYEHFSWDVLRPRYVELIRRLAA